MDTLDWLIVLGGPMSVSDEKKYPWLAAEKRFIEKAIGNAKRVIGICLGAQLIANVLGARVYRNRFKEIGWFPVTLSRHAGNSRLFSGLPDRFTAFHWHGDTFDLPDGADLLASSEGCTNQAFQYGSRVIGLQYHMETTPKSAGDLIDHCGDEIAEEKYVQPAAEMLADNRRFEAINRTMGILLTNMDLHPCGGTV